MILLFALLYFLDPIERAAYFERLFWYAQGIVGGEHRMIMEAESIRKKLLSAMEKENNGAQILLLAEEGIKKMENALNSVLSNGLLAKKIKEAKDSLRLFESENPSLKESMAYIRLAEEAKEKGLALLSYQYVQRVLHLLQEMEARRKTAKKQEVRERKVESSLENIRANKRENIRRSVDKLGERIEMMQKGRCNIRLLYRLKRMHFEARVALAEGDEEKAFSIIKEAYTLLK